MSRRTKLLLLAASLITGLACWMLHLSQSLEPVRSASGSTMADAYAAPSDSPVGDSTEPPLLPGAPPVATGPRRSNQPEHLRPRPTARSPDWQLLDWSVQPLPDKPGVQLRASCYLASGKYPFVRVEQEIQILPDGEAKVLKTVEMVGDQIIVKLPNGSPVEEIRSLAARLGGQAAAEPFAPDTWLVAVPRKLEAVPEALVSTTDSGIPVDYAEPNHLVRPMRTPNDPRFANFNQWHLYNNSQIDKDIKAPRAWDRRTSAAHGTTNNVIVAVIDSGVRYTHEDLVPNMWVNPGEIPGDRADNDGNGLVDDVYGADYVNNDGDPMTSDSHGTHCAGLIAAAGDNGSGVTGVAWDGVGIMALRFIEGGSGSVSDSIKCIDYARTKGAKVINASYGSYSRSDTGNSSEAAAIHRAQQAGIVFVAAAGNDGTNNDASPFFPASYTEYVERIFPRRAIALNNIIAVGATDRNDNKAGFSNFGATSVDLMAPGVEMWSTTASGDATYSASQGSSFAAPVVAGAVALLIAEYPNDTLSQRVARVVSTNAVDVIPALSGLCVTGGRLNLAKLLPAADPATLPQALAWHRPSYTEPLINSAMRTPSVVSLSNNVTVYSGTKKFNNTNGVNTSGLVNQTGGWIIYRTSPSATWSSNSLTWHSNNGDYQFWKATISNVVAGSHEYFLQLDFDSGARTTYSFHADNADGFSAGTNRSVAQASPYTFNVPKNAATVAIGNANQTYDGSARAVSVTTTPPGLPVSVTYDDSTSPPTNAGSYAVVATITDLDHEGSASATLTVAKAPAGLLIGSLNQTYDGTPRAVSIAITPSDLAATVTYDGSALAPADAGSYSVVATVNDANYAGSATNTLVVAKAAPVINQVPVSSAIIYGQSLAASALTGGSASVSGSFAFTAPATVPAAGTSSQSVTFTPSDSPNFLSVAASVDVTVNKAPASVQFGNLSQAYDGTPKTVTVTTTPPDLVASVTYDGDGAAPTDIGSYAVVATLSDPNYEGSASGTLEITEGTALIDVSGLDQTYDGLSKPVTVSTDPPGLPVVLTYDGALDAPLNAGTYTVVATVDDANYRGSVTNALKVAKGVAGIAFDGLSQTYDGTERAVSVSTTPAGLSATVTYDENASAPANAGSYSVVATIDDANYAGSATDTLVVAKDAPVINQVPAASAITYGQTLFSSILIGGSSSVSGSFAFTAPATAPAAGTGSQSVTFTPSDSANFLSVAASVDVTVSKAPASVHLGNLAQGYDGTPKTVTVTTIPPGLTTSVTYDGGGAEPTDLGSYMVVATVADPNYEGSASGTLAIELSAYDAWRLENFGESWESNPASAGSADADGDGADNHAEFYLGTDPADPGSRLRISAAPLGAASATVTIGPAVTAGVYRLKSWSDLTVTPISTELEISENAASASFEVPAGADRNFYQLLYTPPPLP